MIKIRLARHGAKNSPFYRIVAIDQRLKQGGKPKAILGFYNPVKKEFKLDQKLYENWISKGAQVGKSVKDLIRKEKI
jgi:small subunit ribosomal protein S16